MLSIKYTPKWIKLGSVVAIVLAPALWMTLQIVRSQGVTCRVCMEYKGEKNCREAQGPSQDECRRTAVDNACALIARGMTESIQCSNTPPSEVQFSK